MLPWKTTVLAKESGGAKGRRRCYVRPVTVLPKARGDAILGDWWCYRVSGERGSPVTLECAEPLDLLVVGGGVTDCGVAYATGGAMVTRWCPTTQDSRHFRCGIFSLCRKKFV